MNPHISILLIEDNPVDAELLERQLLRDGLSFDLMRVENREQMIDVLENKTVDIVISDFMLPSFTGLEALKLFKQYDLDVPFITLTGTGAEEIAVEMMKYGSDDYVLKQHLKRLSHSIVNNLQKAQSARQGKLQEKALIDSERAYRLLADNSGDIISRHKITGEFIYASPAIIAITGFTPEEVMGRKLRDYLHPDDHEIMHNHVQAILKGEPQNRLELRLLTRKGDYIWIETTGKGIVNPGTGLVDEIVAITRDATIRKKTEESLILSEERYRIITETASDVIITIDQDGGILFVNQAVEKIFGYLPEEIIGQKINILMPLSLGESHRQGMEDYIKTGHKKLNWLGVETIGRHKSGKEFEVEISFGETSIHNNRIFSAIIRDIHDRKYVQNMLVESSNRLSLIYNTSSDLMFLLSVEPGQIYRYLSVNRSFQTITGIKEEQIIGKKIEDILPKMSYTSFFLKLSEAISTKSPVKFNEMLNMGSVHVNVETTLTPVYDQGDICINILGSSRDITEEKKVLDLLKKSESAYRLLAENATDMITKHDLSGNYFYVSTASYSLLGYAPEDLIGKCAFDFLHPDDWIKIKSGVDDFIRLSFGVYTASYRYRKKDGTYTWIESTNKILYKDGSDEVEGVIAVSRDITERKSFEAKLEDKIKELDTFIYRSSHDLKGPLASLLGLVNVAKTELQEPQSLEYMHMIERSVKHLDSILMDLLNITRITQGHLNNTPVNFNELIHATLKSFENLEEFRKVEIMVDIEQKTNLYYDKSLLNNILHNLIINAIKYKDPKKSQCFVKIRLTQHEHEVELLISDNGEGIPEQMQRSVFEMFFRGNTKSSGTGLGLYIVKNAVSKLGGNIYLNSVEGEGSTFRISLPVVSSEVVSNY
jgi:PAS domain S-box-containing protein